MDIKVGDKAIITAKYGYTEADHCVFRRKNEDTPITITAIDGQKIYFRLADGRAGYTTYHPMHILPASN